MAEVFDAVTGDQAHCDGYGAATHVQQGRMFRIVSKPLDEERAVGRDNTSTAAVEELYKPLAPELEVKEGLFYLRPREVPPVLYARLIAFDVLDERDLLLIGEKLGLHWCVWYKEPNGDGYAYRHQA